MDKIVLMRQIGANLQKHRNGKQLTQEALASMVDKNTTTITRFESGQRMMSVSSLVDIAQALNISCDALIFGDTKDAAVQNIIKMLENETEETLERIARIIRICLEEFHQ